ncbi:MAG: hypothetical protein M1358_09570 [Chloroflexi bacterium]|nr:hypothetical protein [Chloroflexota bacterium]
MKHKILDEQTLRLLEIAGNLSRAHGWQIVTQDKRLFPHVEPALATLKNGTLGVFAIKVFPQPGQFLRPEELIHIRDDLDQFVRENTPEDDPRVERIEKVAVVMTPEDVRAVAPIGDIIWVVIRDEDALPDALDRVLLVE